MDNLDPTDAPTRAADPPFQRRDLFAWLAACGAAGLGESAAAQDAVRTNPRAYRTVFENDRVRAVEYTSRPGIGVCGAGRHSHPAHLTVALTKVKARVTLPDGKVVIVENEPGDVFWEDAATHTVENVGGSGARVVIVEFKDAGCKPSTGV